MLLSLGLAALSLLFPQSGSSGDESAEGEPHLKQFVATVTAIEAALQGKPHPDVDSLIVPSAVAEGRPLREVIREVMADPTKKVKPFPEDSQLLWLGMESIESGESKYLIPEEGFPEGINRDMMVLVMREVEQKGDRTFRVLYWLTLDGGEWKMVHVVDGWLPTEPLHSAFKRVPQSLVRKR